MIRSFLKGSKRYFILTVLFGALVSLLDLINPKIISYTVDVLLSGGQKAVSGPVRRLIEVAGGEIYLRSQK